MGRPVAVIWHASFSVIAAVLYFFFVLPRWWELIGATPHVLGTVLRIATAVLVGLAALPVVFTLQRTRKPEYGTPQLALTLLVWAIVAQVLSAVLIAGTAISEIWLSLDRAGPWLFGSYGAAAAIALLGIGAFYLSFVAELPPPPPKPIKAKKPRKLKWRRGDKKAPAGAQNFDQTGAPETVDDADVDADIDDDIDADTDIAEVDAAGSDDPIETDAAQDLPDTDAVASGNGSGQGDSA